MGRRPTIGASDDVGLEARVERSNQKKKGNRDHASDHDIPRESATCIRHERPRRPLSGEGRHSLSRSTQHPGFTLEHQQFPAFASVSLGDVQMPLSGPGASGSRPMPNGERQEPGGWNRVVLKVNALPGYIAELKKAGLRFRNDMEVPGAARTRSRIRTGIRSSCSNPRENHRSRRPGRLT
jgi:glyoxylase I family protein